MTIPWLMNCSHSDTGWCLDCTSKIGHEREALIAALRPFALWADSMYTLKDDDKVCGIYVRHFREAAKLLNE